MAARSIIHGALMKFGGISTTTRFLVLPNTRFSYFQLPLRKSLFTSTLHRRSPKYCAFGHLTNLDDAYDSFDKLIAKPPYSDSLFYKLLKVVTEWKYYAASLYMFNEMCAVDVPVNQLTIDTVIECYSRLYDTEKLSMLLGFCIKRDDIELSYSDYHTILDGFVEGESTHGAENLFKKFIKNKLLFEDHANFSYVAMIAALCKIGSHFKAIALLRLMDGRRGYGFPWSGYISIVDGLCKDMMIDDAFRVFEEMKFHRNIPPHVFTYNSLLYALSMSGRWNEVCWILKEMHDQKIIIRRRTFNILINALCKQGKMKEAETVDFIMVHILEYGYRDINAYTSLIEGYCLNGELNRAMSTLESMEKPHFPKVKPTIHIYNILLDRFTSLDDTNFWSYKRDLDSMYDRAGWEIEENSVTRYIWYRERMGKPSDDMKVLMQNQKYSVYMLCLMDHCDKYEVDAALDLFYFMDGKELNSNTHVYNILIDCANRCGRFNISRNLFRDLFFKGLEPNLDTYALMIRGFCERGLPKDAKKLFLKMQKSGWHPKSSINVDDIIQEYTETKPIDDVTKLFIEAKRRGYNMRVDECFKFVAEYSSILSDTVIPVDQEIYTSLTTTIVPSLIPW